MPDWIEPMYALLTQEIPSDENNYAFEFKWDGIRSLAEKAAAVAERLRTEFPAVPDTARTAGHPFFGPMNCFGWLLTVPNHYNAHLSALREGRSSAL